MLVSLQIDSATFSFGNASADVTERVRVILQADGASFVVGPPALGADPKPYKIKTLRIGYRLGAMNYTQDFREGVTVKPADLLPPGS